MSFDPTQERPCVHCGVWPSEGQEHILADHQRYDSMAKETHDALVRLNDQALKKMKPTTAEIIDRWRDELEAGL